MDIQYLQDPPLGWVARDIALGDKLPVLFSGFGAEINTKNGIVIDDERHLGIIAHIEEVLKQREATLPQLQESLDSIGIPMQARDWLIMRELQKALRDPAVLPPNEEGAGLRRAQQLQNIGDGNHFSMKQKCDDGLAVCCENSIISQLVFQALDVRSSLMAGVLATSDHKDADGDYEPEQHNWLVMDGTNGQVIFFDPANSLRRDDGEAFPRISSMPREMFEEFIAAAGEDNVLAEVKQLTANGPGWHYGVNSGIFFAIEGGRILSHPELKKPDADSLDAAESPPKPK